MPPTVLLAPWSSGQLTAFFQLRSVVQIRPVQQKPPPQAFLISIQLMMEDPEYKNKQSVIFHNQLLQPGIGRVSTCLYLIISDKLFLIQLFDKQIMNERSLLSNSYISQSHSYAIYNQKHQDLYITLRSTRAQTIDQL